MAAAHVDPMLNSRDISLDMERLPAKLPGFTKEDFEDTCKRRFFFDASFGAPNYSVAGLYDLGPVVCRIKANVIDAWRTHFVLEENMLEIETTCTTPEEVFKTSGHTERFADVMVKDMVTGECIRIDKYIEEWTDKILSDKVLASKYTEEQRKELAQLQILADGMTIPQFQEVIAKWDLKSPKGNELSEPKDFNMMFKTHIGPEGDRVGYLRPELAQGIILNFKRILEFNGGKMPIASAAMGPAFRNEIAPRQNLIRVREFFLAEIEHFLDPTDKSHPKIDNVRDVRLWAWPKQWQEEGKPPQKMTINEALEAGYIANETLAYFIARVKMFMNQIGIRFVRFRQHRSNEMAHYACDCWDAECLTGWGWIECTGIADRSAYDLECHMEHTKMDFKAYKRYDVPREVEYLAREFKKGPLNKALRADGAATMQYVEGLSEEEALKLGATLKEKGEVDLTVPKDGAEVSVKLTSEMLSIERKTRKVEGENYTPGVIEPSFGIGRIIYALLEQSYFVRREGAQTPAAIMKAALEVSAAETSAIDPELEQLIAVQADKVKALKAAKVPKDQIDTAVAKLKELKTKAGVVDKPKVDKKKKEKQEETRSLFSIPARIACYKVALVPLSPSVLRTDWCKALIAEWRAVLVRRNITYKVDESSQSIGKKYSRIDEIGVPFVVTIDPDTEKDQQVTLRERDTMQQIYVPNPKLGEVLYRLCVDDEAWDSVKGEFKAAVRDESKGE